MSSIKISLAEVSEAASRIRSLNQQMYESLSEMKKEMNSLAGGWESDGAEEIRRRFNLLSARFEEHKSAIDSYARFLDQTVSSYDTLESTITGNASGIQY